MLLSDLSRVPYSLSNILDITNSQKATNSYKATVSTVMIEILILSSLICLGSAWNQPSTCYARQLTSCSDIREDIQQLRNYLETIALTLDQLGESYNACDILKLFVKFDKLFLQLMIEIAPPPHSNH